MSMLDTTRQDKTRQDNTRQDKTRHDENSRLRAGQNLKAKSFEAEGLLAGCAYFVALAEAKGYEKRSDEKEKKKTSTKKIGKGQGKTSRQRALRLRACRLAVLISWQ